ncbi:MAG: site-specific DNA-methyltransferase [Candidatus Pacebacteria bacterium]|nr:site-specific DNA-methyltransferase [Candidatus Paceibacterota bacterium]
MKVNQVLHGNSIEVMKSIPREFVDLTVTSPPYGTVRNYTGNNYSFDDFKHQVKELFRITKRGGVVVWVVRDQTENGSESGDSFRQALYFMECGFNLHDTMIYAKNYYVPLTHNRYEQAFEYMFVFSKGKPTTFNGLREKCSYEGAVQPTEWNAASSDDKCALRKRKGGYVTKSSKLKSNIWYYSPGKRLDEIGNQHPAIFPYELAQDHINTWTNSGDLVFDPMCGSGTTLVMAKELGRNFLGIDIVDKYVAISKERLGIND